VSHLLKGVGIYEIQLVKENTHDIHIPHTEYYYRNSNHRESMDGLGVAYLSLPICFYVVSNRIKAFPCSFFGFYVVMGISVSVLSNFIFVLQHVVELISYDAYNDENEPTLFAGFCAV